MAAFEEEIIVFFFCLSMFFYCGELGTGRCRERREEDDCSVQAVVGAGCMLLIVILAETTTVAGESASLVWSATPTPKKMRTIIIFYTQPATLLSLFLCQH